MSRIGKLPITIPTGVTVTRRGRRRCGSRGRKGKLGTRVPPARHAWRSRTARSRVARRDDRARRARAARPHPQADRQHGDRRQHRLPPDARDHRRRLPRRGEGQERCSSPRLLASDRLPAAAGRRRQGRPADDRDARGQRPQLLGEVAAQIRALRPPEPYKGKGIKYAGRTIRRKAGKAAGAAGDSEAWHRQINARPRGTRRQSAGAPPGARHATSGRGCACSAATEAHVRAGDLRRDRRARWSRRRRVVPRCGGASSGRQTARRARSASASPSVCQEQRHHPGGLRSQRLPLSRARERGRRGRARRRSEVLRRSDMAIGRGRERIEIHGRRAQGEGRSHQPRRQGGEGRPAVQLQRAGRRRRRQRARRLRPRQGERGAGGDPQGDRGAKKALVTVPIADGTIPFDVHGTLRRRPRAPASGQRRHRRDRRRRRARGGRARRGAQRADQVLGSNNPHNMVKATIAGAAASCATPEQRRRAARQGPSRRFDERGGGARPQGRGEDAEGDAGPAARSGGTQRQRRTLRGLGLARHRHVPSSCATTRRRWG